MAGGWLKTCKNPAKKQNAHATRHNEGLTRFFPWLHKLARDGRSTATKKKKKKKDSPPPPPQYYLNSF